MKKLLCVLLGFSLFLTACQAKSSKDIMGIEFGTNPDKVFKNLENEGWTRTVNKRSYEIYQKSSFNGFVNPVYTCNYAGRGTGDFAYSVLTLNLYDEDSLKKYASYKDTIISTNNLKLTLKKEYTKGNLKNQIESGGALLVQDYTICLYQDSTKPVTGKDPIDIIIIELYMYDVTNSRYFTEEQIYSLGPKAQKTITNQLFEGA